jgi:hypothetical protein
MTQTCRHRPKLLFVILSTKRICGRSLSSSFAALSRYFHATAKATQSAYVSVCRETVRQSSCAPRRVMLQPKMMWSGVNRVSGLLCPHRGTEVRWKPSRSRIMSQLVRVATTTSPVAWQERSSGPVQLVRKMKQKNLQRCASPMCQLRSQACGSHCRQAATCACLRSCHTHLYHAF